MVILGPDQAILLFSIDSPPFPRSPLPRTSSSAHVTTSPVPTELRTTYTMRNGHLTTFPIYAVHSAFFAPSSCVQKGKTVSQQPVPDPRTVEIAFRVVNLFGWSIGSLHSASKQRDFNTASPADARMDGEDGGNCTYLACPSCDA